MKRIAQTVLLKDDEEAIRAYEHYHAHPWPIVTDTLAEVGIHRMYIFRFGRQLFMFMEATDDFELSHMKRFLEKGEDARKWELMMQDFQEPVEGAPADAKWVQMTEVFRFEA